MSQYQNLADLKEKVKADLTLTEENVSQKSLEVPVIYHRYLDIYIKQLKQLKKLQIDRDQMYQKKYHHYKFDHGFSLGTKSEVDIYVYGDNEFLQICQKFNQQEVIVKYLEQVLKQVSQISFNIKNYVEYQKFLHGN